MLLMSLPIWNRAHGFGIIVSLVIVAVVCYKGYNAHKKVKLLQFDKTDKKVEEGAPSVDLAQMPKAEAEEAS